MNEQTTLFGGMPPTNIPLAERVRPQTVDDILGQTKLLSESGPLRGMIESGSYSSFILWGPPGSGKTTIARLIERVSGQRFVSFSAVLASIKDVKGVMEEADYLLRTQNKNTILFIDEIHRFNKSQQDAFLPYVEAGAIILIGATTENPSFEVISALLSRCHVFVLERLGDDDLAQIIDKALLASSREMPAETVAFLAQQAGGDARKALNDLEVVLRQIPANAVCDPEAVNRILARRAMFYDKKGEEHYNLISALHKSLRGSDPQAGLYWLARMLESGEDPLYIVRRLMRFASEDVGLADPQALVQAQAVREAVHFLGMPEANTAIAQLVVYLATAPKSNAIYRAINQAAEDARFTRSLGVPLHIRNAPTDLMKDLEYGKDYQYDHDFQYHYHYQKYFPDRMPEKTYYEPSDFGFEKDIRKRLDWWKKLREKQENQ
jgi:putative ATPase